MTEDADLLRHYAEDRSEPALTELVNRHLAQVHSTALRRLGGDTHHAADVVQKVFSTMAQRAGSLSRHPSLAGWLHLASKHAAIDIVKSEQRRRLREREAMDLQELHSPAPIAPEADALRQRIDAVLDSLGAREREAVLLRHYKDLSYAEIGSQLKMSEDAARMCVTRALERIRAALGRKGITSSSAAIAALLSSEAATSVPAGLGVSIVQGILAGKTGLGVLALSSMSLVMNTGKIVLSATALLTVSTAGWLLGERSDLARLRMDLATEQAREAEQSALLASLKSESEALSGKLTESKVDATAMRRRLAGIPANQEIPSEEQVRERFQNAPRLAAQGLYEQALNEYAWLMTVGMKHYPTLNVLRSNVLPRAIMSLARQYPPARDALAKFRDEVEQAVISMGSTDTLLLINLNRSLGTPERTLSAYDAIPKGDKRRSSLAACDFEGFLNARRYADAAAGIGMPALLFHLERAIEQTKSGTLDEPSKQANNRSAVDRTALGIEMLAATGELENAHTLAKKLLHAFDSPATRERIAAAYTRAGHPELAITLPAQ